MTRTDLVTPVVGVFLRHIFLAEDDRIRQEARFPDCRRDRRRDSTRPIDARKYLADTPLAAARPESSQRDPRTRSSRDRSITHASKSPRARRARPSGARAGTPTVALPSFANRPKAHASRSLRGERGHKAPIQQLRRSVAHPSARDAPGPLRSPRPLSLTPLFPRASRVSRPPRSRPVEMELNAADAPTEAATGIKKSAKIWYTLTDEARRWRRTLSSP